MRFFAEAPKYVVDGRMKDAASVAKLGEGGVLVPLDLVAKELGAGLAYDAAKGIATLETPDGRFVLAAGKAGVTSGGLTKPLTRNVKAVPVATAATLLVPPGFFEDHLGCRVVSLDKDNTAVVERRKFSDDAPSTVTGEPAEAEEAKPAAGVASPWAGKWETTIGAMDIAVAADGAVDLAYDGEFGRLTGRVDGGRLAGRF
ncbi:MAG: copper amine oxidase N-terminal domain-containing protein, partial [Acidobacteria bacterium]|nr:copper amine oxidase N-terminal domain-containing protein [Acidobacteriota bacterium]